MDKSRYCQLFECITKKIPVETLALLGSFARNEQTPESDTDVMIEFIRA